jgi:hypothetical protein
MGFAQVTHHGGDQALEWCDIHHHGWNAPFRGEGGLCREDGEGGKGEGAEGQHVETF